MLFSSTGRSNLIKGNVILSFAKYMHKNVGRSISKTLSSKDSQKLLDHAK